MLLPACVASGTAISCNTNFGHYQSMRLSGLERDCQICSRSVSSTDDILLMTAACLAML